MWTVVILATALLCRASGAAELTIRYYNETQVSVKALATAIETASRAMRIAGVKVRWVNCYADGAGCKDAASTTFDLVLTTAARTEGVFAQTANYSMGYSLLPKGEQGVHAKILWSRVLDYASTHDVPAAIVLGNVMAHEIGHLLLNSGAHSRCGIMKASWSHRDSRLLGDGRMSFEGHEAAAMRRRLAAGIQ